MTLRVVRGARAVGAVGATCWLLALATGCSGESDSAARGARIADVPAAISPVGDSAAAVLSAVPVDGDVASLARAAGGAGGTEYIVRPISTPGVILAASPAARRAIRASHPPTISWCADRSVSPSYRAATAAWGTVWCGSSVSRRGPRDDAPRRVKLTLDGCRLEPRVQRVAVGSTVLVNGRDAMMSRLQFVAAGESASRTTVLLSDAGQVVPTSDATSAPALVQVSDDMHPWVRAWLVVAPHPYVAVTAADGEFRFDNVPPGKYTMIVWHERLGTKRTTVRVDAAVQTRLEIAY